MRRAFTLAEVLITLAIIGIIAAVSIPALLNNIEMQQHKVAYKKAYAFLNQATRKIAFDNGGTIKGLFSNSLAFRDGMAPYFNSLKQCTYSDAWGNCWHNNRIVKYMNGSTRDFGDDGGAPSAVLSNGMFILFDNEAIACDDTSGTVLRCGLIWLDVNGFKSPNIIGKDIFRLHVLENNIKPYGITGDGYEDTCDFDEEGYSCAAEYLYN